MNILSPADSPTWIAAEKALEGGAVEPCRAQIQAARRMEPVAGKPEVAIQIPARLGAIAPHIVFIAGGHGASIVQHLPNAAEMIKGIKVVSAIGSGQPLFTLRKLSAHHAVSGTFRGQVKCSSCRGDLAARKYGRQA
jgi:hypothetical protein